jgi:hypothetical protein
MRCRLWLLLVFFTLLGGCRGESARVDPREEHLVALERAFFSEELNPCTESSECRSGHCDLTPVYTISVSAGYCVSFPSAYERWQKVELAGHLAKYAREFPQLALRVEERLAKEYLAGDRPSDLETAYIVLVALGTDTAITRLAAEYERRTGTVQEVAGLALAEAGDKRGIEAVVGAAFSPVVRVRLHAARAAARLCSVASLGVLAELLDDDNSLVSEAAATALGQCPGERSLALLKEHQGFAARSARLEAMQ